MPAIVQAGLPSKVSERPMKVLVGGRKIVFGTQVQLQASRAARITPS